jgi:hypothetical protein
MNVAAGSSRASNDVIELHFQISRNLRARSILRTLPDEFRASFDRPVLVASFGFSFQQTNFSRSKSARVLSAERQRCCEIGSLHCCANPA